MKIEQRKILNELNATIASVKDLPLTAEDHEYVTMITKNTIENVVLSDEPSVKRQSAYRRAEGAVQRLKEYIVFRQNENWKTTT